MKHLMILMILFNFNRKIRVKITNILIGKRKLLYYPCTYLSTTEKRQELDHFTILNSCLGLVSTIIYFQIITVCFMLGQSPFLFCNSVLFTTTELFCCICVTLVLSLSTFFIYFGGTLPCCALGGQITPHPLIFDF